MKIRKVLNILFWIALAVGIILLIWKIFGKSPTDLAVIMPFILMLILKMWVISDEIKDFKHDVKVSFDKIKVDVNSLRKK